MRALIQRVLSGKVTINQKMIGEIEKGYVILLGVREGDSEREAEVLAEKTVNLRIMSDVNDKMNLSVEDKEGGILVVSQFTLYADCKGGRRPSFIKAAKPELAKNLYLHFVAQLRKLGVKNVQTGEFGAYMLLEIVNDGPVTIMLDSDELSK
ncbi:D-tyrosyl-tRNA(Tyr) deacylase [Candidatus Gottesmanbacteria bacterium CG11_big_fil_rev_8_21_14_0_20_37_11]|uniref:D-aminoacyl-tRNA deacylase n=3 Tax=Candidatus Gottesmaniibacteriota TaxID=1752720 RepID=A0A2M7RR21_9BACT|nr:MAG: D-tyrosyl-tRNA(Tyr) deacylase [Candidatus Gottesmanbacteria bacterium CG1_02_37_22]PIP33277.1 MAG: D-tyrosyl-tRNA(Tyr) deacylase [Candidatus Gottesmanbacteria bacterium CG23_combo_of_CG06-09_8_20_14_all_37_19]PIR08341.1 MAG: D-tyrosyl-tRNA(Tyr) deacylase [Candidatus Gottesmanbacteria bacterium CG11_big_fil_rev_8_21_14_0_20_37_11]PIZ02761.1 MAG: D-tyrosyl-tRNA(Tyr) deacylase [Candidatus Gottesmanbacteria bacterium CG_4_10_14_0_8_um_filter_37_24]